MGQPVLNSVTWAKMSHLARDPEKAKNGTPYEGSPHFFLPHSCPGDLNMCRQVGKIVFQDAWQLMNKLPIYVRSDIM